MENGVRQTIASNTPSILTDTTGIPANPKRIAFSIQNVGTNPLFLLLVPPNSSATASSTVYHTVLKAGTGNDDGTGGSYSMENGVVFTGFVSVAGTSPRYVVTEIAPG